MEGGEELDTAGLKEGNEGGDALNEVTYLIEVEEVLKRLEHLAIPKKNSTEAEADLEWITRTLEKYQEQSNLLDPALEPMLNIVLGRARAIILKHESSARSISNNVIGGKAEAFSKEQLAFPFQVFDDAQLHHLFVFVYNLCRLRGAKTVIKFFPHEASDLEPVLHVLQSQDRQDHQRWHTRYCLLLWLSMLALVPFDICSIDSGTTLSTTEEDSSSATLVGAISDLAVEYLKDPGPTRDAAAVCLASLLKRPDMEEGHLSKFLTWSEGILSHDPSTAAAEDNKTVQRDLFLTTGVLQTLSVLLKAGHRQNLLAFLPSLLHSMTQLEASHFSVSQTLNRKLKMKLLQRIGLAYLPPRIATWRYQRGQRSLLDNLMVNNRQQQQGGGGKDDADKKNSMSEGGGEEEEDEEEAALIEKIPEDLEEIVEELLLGLRDRDTIVRWSAAKGIGRITGRLPRSFADEVVASVLLSFAEGATDSAWHGGCLALAELARRGLLLPSRLEEVVPVVAKAIQYDVRRGYTSVGAHVRDAACYVCWAFARAYSPQVMKPFVQKLCEGMLLCSLFDREINCRRAASAAFQENVGRQGHENFPYGIDILTAADYFTLGNRTTAYLTISPQVAKFPPYKYPIIDHLTQVKLSHWDASIRSLASLGLSHLTALAPNYMLEVILPYLLKYVDAVDLNRRHGAIIGIAEIFLALAQRPIYLPAELMEGVVGIVPKIEGSRLYRGRGGEFVRAAACRLMECLSLAQTPLFIKMQLRLLDSIDDNLKSPLEDVQSKAVAAVRAFTKTYFGQGEKAPSQRLQARVLDRYLKMITTEENVAVTRGFSLAVGALPSRLLRPSIDEVIAALDDLAEPTRRVGDEPDAETRRCALLALVNMCQTVGIGASQGGLHSTHVEKAFPILLRSTGDYAMDKRGDVEKAFSILLRSTGDYAMDKRGDVGSWCRQTALRGLATLLKLATAAGRLHPQSSSIEQQQQQQKQLSTNQQVLTNYGLGTIKEIRCDGRVCLVLFSSASEVGSYYFPYGGLALLPISSCRPKASEHSAALWVPDLQTRSQQATSSSSSSLAAAVAAASSSSTNRRPISTTATNASVSSTTINTRRTSCHYIGPALITSIICAILKQLSEKLDVVRECAGEVLVDLLQSYSPRIPGISERLALEAALFLPPPLTTGGATSSNADGRSGTEHDPRHCNWASPSVVFPRIVRLLSIEAYHKPVVSGMIISVGGLTESVVKASLASIVDWSVSIKKAKQIGILGRFSKTLLSFFEEYRGDDRVILPLLRSIDLFFQKGIFEEEGDVGSSALMKQHNAIADEAAAPGPSSVLSQGLLAYLRQEMSGCKDVKKLLACLSVTIHLLAQGDQMIDSALPIIMVFLGHRFPRIRKAAAEQLYTKLLLSDHILGPEKGLQLDVVLEALSTTSWDADDLLEIRQARDEICSLLGAKPPAESTVVKKVVDRGSSKENRDELASYAALVKDVGY